MGYRGYIQTTKNSRPCKGRTRTGKIDATKARVNTAFVLSLSLLSCLLHSIWLAPRLPVTLPSSLMIRRPERPSLLWPVSPLLPQGPQSSLSLIFADPFRPLLIRALRWKMTERATLEKQRVAELISHLQWRARSFFFVHLRKEFRLFSYVFGQTVTGFILFEYTLVTTN